MVAPACKKSNPRDFPLVAIDEIVYLSNGTSQPLQTIGGSIFHNGGFRGLIIYRRFNNMDGRDFAAYDRACPQHYEEDCSRLEKSDDNLFVECPCHGERYLLFDGSPDSSGSISLMEYRATSDGQTVRIRN